MTSSIVMLLLRNGETQLQEPNNIKIKIKNMIECNFDAAYILS